MQNLVDNDYQVSLNQESQS